MTDFWKPNDEQKSGVIRRTVEFIFDESEEHEEPPEYVYRLETQLSTLIGDTTNAHMSWEESK